MWKYRESVLLQEPEHRVGHAALKRLGHDKFMEI
jgi:hypothetical protein